MSLFLSAPLSVYSAIVDSEGVGVRSRTMDQVKNWILNSVGKTYGSGECVAYCNAYLAELWDNNTVSGNARDWKNKCPYGWTVVDLQGSLFNCQLGDIIVEDYSPYGHVAIYWGYENGYHRVYDSNYRDIKKVQKHEFWQPFSSPTYCFRPPITSAVSATILSGVYVIHSAWDDNICLDIQGDSKENDANIQLYQRVNNDVQKFRVIRYGDYYCIKSIYSGLWLDVKLPIGDNSNVKLYYENTNEENDWQFEDAGGGYFYIRNRTGYYLDVQGDRAVNNANIQLYHFVGNNSQKWRLEDVTKYVNAGGICKIRSAYNDNMCIDIAGNSKENRANIQLYENINDDVQKFRIYKDGNFSCFKSIYSDKWLDIRLPIENKANVQLWQSCDSDEEKWIFEDAGDGYVYIQNKTGFYLDLEYDNPVNHANIQIYRFTGNNSQRWRIDDLTDHMPVEEGVYTIHSAWNDNMCLDIQGNSTENRANVILYQYENTNMQKYRVYKYGEYYCLKSIHANKWLDIKTPFGNNSNVQLWDSNNADEEYWIFEDAGNGYVYIRSKLGYYLDLQGDNPVNWANIQIYNYVGTNSQKWKLKRDLEPDMVTVADVVTTSDATSVEPSVIVKVNNKTLTKNTDYSVEITTDIADGKGVALITGKGDYCGSITKEFSISIIPPKHEIGDTDLDGRIDIRDVTAIQRHIAELEFFTEVQLALADTNGDRKVDIADATHLQMYLAEYDVQLG